MTSQPATQVFISYTSRDASGQEWSRRVHQRLEAAGIRCFRDREGLGAGDDYLTLVQARLDESAAVVMIVSPSAMDSDWVKSECLSAQTAGKWLVPVIVEAGLRVPPPFTSRLALDFIQDEEAAWDSLLARLSELSDPRRLEPDRLREYELAYLQRLLGKPEVVSAGQLYGSLAGQQAESRFFDALQDICVPSSYRHQQLRQRQPATSSAPTRVIPVESVLASLRTSRRMALLGAPGAGKTYTLNRLAAELAQQALADEAAPLPVVVPLGLWNEALPDEQAATDALEVLLREQLGSDLAPHHDTLKSNRRLVLLLDGLNELPGGDERADKSEAVWQLARDEAWTLVVVSCREKDFQDADTHLQLDTLTIEPLDPPHIKAYIEAYLAQQPESGRSADELFWHLAGGDAARRCFSDWQEAGLDEGLFWQDRPLDAAAGDGYDDEPLEEYRLRWLEQRRRNTLFVPRSLLKLADRPYFLTMLVLLYYYDGIEAFSANRAQLFQRFVDDAVERDSENYSRSHPGQAHPGRAGLLEALGCLAWEMQTDQKGEAGMRQALPVSVVNGIVSDTQQHLAQGAGLLRWQGRKVRFSHQLLQEYFAAIELRRAVKDDKLAAANLWPKAQWWKRSGWEETAVFAAGLEPENPDWIVQWLHDAQPMVLRQCLQESGCAGPTAKSMDSLRQAWLRRLDPARERDPEGRHGIAMALGGLGLDNRPGLGLGSDGLPDIAWVDIPAGEFLYGEEREKRATKAFQIARYPISNAQYQAFIDAGGYAEPRWWEDLAQTMDAPKQGRWQEPNRPRERVNWYEAMAYSRWLSDALGAEVTLPTEQQWEKAARGTDGRAYPWGDTYQPGQANVDESIGDKAGAYLKQTTAVGLYPQGDSPYGISDLAGNVWEWCLNEYQQPENTQAGGNTSRVLRGGAWGGYPGSARSAYRDRDHPVLRDDVVGFRLVRVFPISR